MSARSQNHLIAVEPHLTLNDGLGHVPWSEQQPVCLEDDRPRFGQEIAAFTSATTFFSTVGLHLPGP